MVRRKWRRKVIPSCLEQARTAISRIREEGIPDMQVELDEALLTFHLQLNEGEDPEVRVAEIFDWLWPVWRECMEA